MPTEFQLPEVPDNSPAPYGPLAGLLPDVAPPAPVEQPAERVPVETPFVTSLKLTEEREKWLVDYALKRMEEVKKEMGLDAAFKVMPGSWMAIREQNEMSADGDYSWRTMLPGSVFETGANLTLGTNKRHTRYLAARIQDDLFGTSPSFAALGKNPDKDKLAKQAEEFMQNEVERSNVIDGIRNAQHTAIDINECVVKVSYLKDATPYIGPAEVMVEPVLESAIGPDGLPLTDETGAPAMQQTMDEKGAPKTRPIKTPEKGLYIYRDDNFLPDPTIAPKPDGTPGLVVLEKDPSFTIDPARMQYGQFQDLAQTFIRYEGPVAEEIDFRNFLCPLKVDDIHKADINVHLYHETPLKMQERFGQVDVGRRYFDQATGDQEARVRLGEHVERTSSVFERMHVGELYLRVDADQDGKAEEIFLVLDLQNQRAIYYEYLANHFDKRPFEVIPGIEQVKGRWHSIGIYSLNEDDELAIDAWWNRANLFASRSSSMTFYNPQAVDEWQNGGTPQAGGNHAYRLNADFDPDKRPPIFKLNLAEDAEQAVQMMETARQGADSKVGAISVKDASESNLNQSKTATGIVNLQNASDVITKATEKLHIKPITEMLVLVLLLMLRNMDRKRLMLSKDASELVTLNREEIRSLNRDVRLLLTRTRSTQVQETSQTAIQVGSMFADMVDTNPRKAQRLRPLFIQQLKGLEVAEADDICPEVTDEMIQQFEMRQAALQQQQAALALAKTSQPSHGSTTKEPVPRLAA